MSREGGSGKVPIPNALTLNSVGLAGAQFPAWVSLELMDSVYAIDLGALQLRHLAPVLAGTAEFVFLFDFGLSSYIQDDHGNFIEDSLLSTAESLGVEVLRSDSGFPLVRTADLARLFASVPHHQISLLGTANETVDLASLYTQAAEPRWTDPGSALAAMPDGVFFVDIHDDCYVHAEFRDKDASDGAASLMLWLAAGTVAAQRGVARPLRRPNPAELHQILGPDSRFVSSLQDREVTSDSVSILFARTAWKLGAKIEATHRLTYHFAGRWEATTV